MRGGGDVDDNAAAVGNGFFFLLFLFVFLPPTVYSVRLERSFCASVSVCFAVTAARLGQSYVRSWKAAFLICFSSIFFPPSIWFCFRRKIILSGFAFRFVER